MTVNTNEVISSDEVINFPVPKRYLTQMIQALGRIIEADQRGITHEQPPSASPSVPWPDDTTGTEQIHIAWDVVNLTKLRKWLRRHGTALTLLDMAADKPGGKSYRRGSYEDTELLSSRAGWRRTHAVLTRSINKALGNLKGKTVQLARCIQLQDPDQQKTYCVVDAKMAEAWNGTMADNSTPSKRDAMRRPAGRHVRTG